MERYCRRRYEADRWKCNARKLTLNREILIDLLVAAWFLNGPLRRRRRRRRCTRK